MGTSAGERGRLRSAYGGEDYPADRHAAPTRADAAVLWIRPRATERKPAPRQRGRRVLALARGTVLRTDTWFNAFFESYWREYTRLAQLALRLRVSGAGTLRLYRRMGEQGQRLLRQIDFSGRDREVRIDLSDTPAMPESLLFFEMEAHSPRLLMHQAEWVAWDAVTSPVRLVAGYCTFNRASLLLDNLAALFADGDVADVLDRVVVVDQGREKVRAHPAYAALARTAGDRLQLVEQDNLGGAGGFTRCLIEARNTASATHVLLMDDDAILEPESVFRAAAFLSLARGDIAVGGHMLDQFRPRELVESGSRYVPQRLRIDEPSRCRVDRPHDLTPFLAPRPRHYNAWWFFAFPLAVLDRAGLPLPLFLRGDDVEFGCRLLRQGVPTVSLPGVAVWHEPFERKGRGWHAFYELRNLLIVGALHFPAVRARTVARQFLSRLLDELLAYDYYESWLLCEAVAAYLHGPAALRQPPHAVQQRLNEMRAKLAPETQPCDILARLPLTPRSALDLRAARIRRWRLLLRNLLTPSPCPEVQPRYALQGSGEQWYDVAIADVVAVQKPHRPECVVLRRGAAALFDCCFVDYGSVFGFSAAIAARRESGGWRFPP